MKRLIVSDDYTFEDDLYRRNHIPSLLILKQFYRYRYNNALRKLYPLNYAYALDRYRYINKNTKQYFKNVLYIGCGTDKLSSFYREKKANITLVDPSINGVMFEDYETDKKFDLILMIHVLEHMRDPLEVLKKCKDMLTPNGYVYIEVPYTPLYIEPSLTGFSLLTYSEHLWGFRPQSLTDMVIKAGLHIHEINRCYLNIYPQFMVKIPILKYLLYAVWVVIFNIKSFLFGEYVTYKDVNSFGCKNWDCLRLIVKR